ncbi:hypothetical protein FOL47_005337 [Perkinsus chesapeaki]|uniref:BTB domain-containing protein n=1 Tax=Perkinsus chesapeaki TaxID=330153 RepID=A0A7J6LXM7_PERCH|nr:hypothetical protein FOL47_005337 [Perkinsus chesapeaki]
MIERRRMRHDESFLVTVGVAFSSSIRCGAAGVGFASKMPPVKFRPPKPVQFRVPKAAIPELEQKPIIHMGKTLIAQEAKRIKAEHLEEARKILRRKLGKGKEFNMLVHATFPVTNRVEGTKRGKGKGEIAYHVARVPVGGALFQIPGVPGLPGLAPDYRGFSGIQGRFPINCQYRNQTNHFKMDRVCAEVPARVQLAKWQRQGLVGGGGGGVSTSELASAIFPGSLVAAMILSPSVPSIRPDSVKSYRAESVCSGGGGAAPAHIEEGAQAMEGNELLQMNLRRMFEERILTDFTIVCTSNEAGGSGEIKAHSVILAAHSGVLRQQLCQPRSTNKLEIHQKLSVMRALVRFMYFGGLARDDPTLSAADTLSVLAEARNLGIEALTEEMVAQVILPKLDPHNCLSILLHPSLASHPSISREVSAYVGQQLPRLLHTDALRKQLLDGHLSQFAMAHVLGPASQAIATDLDCESVVRFVTEWAGLDSICDLLRQCKSWPEWRQAAAVRGKFAEIDTLSGYSPPDSTASSTEWYIPSLRALLPESAGGPTESGDAVRIIKGQFFSWVVRLDRADEGRIRIVYESADLRLPVKHGFAERLCVKRFPAAQFQWEVSAVSVPPGAAPGRSRPPHHQWQTVMNSDRAPVFICFPSGVNLHWSNKRFAPRLFPERFICDAQRDGFATLQGFAISCTTIPIGVPPGEDVALSIKANLVEIPLVSLILYYFSADLNTTVRSEDILNRLPHMEFRCVSSFSLFQQQLVAGGGSCGGASLGGTTNLSNLSSTKPHDYYTVLFPWLKVVKKAPHMFAVLLQWVAPILSLRVAVAYGSVDRDCERDGMDCVSSLTGTVSAQFAKAKVDLAPNDPQGVDLADQAKDPGFFSNDMKEMLKRRDESQTQSELNLEGQTIFGMNLDTCVDTLEDAVGRYKVFEGQVFQVEKNVEQSESRVRAVIDLSKVVDSKGSTFDKEIESIFDLYNNVAVRANTLEKWMADEKTVRDHLSSVYRILEAKSAQQAGELEEMRVILASAVTKMEGIHSHVSKVLTAVANAETAMYEWAYNVTVKVNAQTTKIVNVAQGMEYRVAQIDNAEIETARMANLLLSLARHYNDGDIADAAEQMVVHTSEEKLKAYRESTTDSSIGSGSLTDMANSLGGSSEILAPLKS